MEWFVFYAYYQKNCHSFQNYLPMVNFLIKKCYFFVIPTVIQLSFQMRPLFDTTITNIKLATHGGLEGMNAVLISSIVASTFNAQLEAWEPLVEPFDAIFK